MWALIQAVFFLALGLAWAAGWVIYGIGWLLYQFFAWAFPPILAWFGEAVTDGEQQFADGYRDATYVPRIDKATEATMQEMAEISDAYVREFHAIVREADEKAKLTAEV